jgi:hypothetical protein
LQWLVGPLAKQAGVGVDEYFLDVVVLGESETRPVGGQSGPTTEEHPVAGE